MTESKRVFWFVVGMIALLGYAYFRYVSGWVSDAPKKESLSTRIETGIMSIVQEIKKEVESEMMLSGSEEESVSGIPDSDEAYQIAAVPITAFTASVSIQNFTPFYNVISESWRERVQTPEFLRDVVFGYVMDKGMNLHEGLSNIEITEEPRMLDEDTLMIRGHVDADAMSFDFTLMVIQEDGQWLADGLEIQFVE
jgi:hypothetical protein